MVFFNLILKITKLFNILVFIKNNDNNKIIKFNINGNN